MNLSEYEDCRLLRIQQTDGQGLCPQDQYKALQISRKNCRPPGEALINAGQNVGEGAQGKKRLWVKNAHPQDRSVCGKKRTEWLKTKVLQITLQWAGLKA